MERKSRQSTGVHLEGEPRRPRQKMASDGRVRVIRILEYRGPKAWIEEAMANTWVSEDRHKNRIIETPDGLAEVIEVLKIVECKDEE